MIILYNTYSFYTSIKWYGYIYRVPKLDVLNSHFLPTIINIVHLN